VDTIALNQENILYTPRGLSRLHYEGKEINEHPDQGRSRGKKAFMAAMAIPKLFSVVQDPMHFFRAIGHDILDF
jgi:hypothetical protein